ncbi:hypothetical protein C1645_744172 [Glomus cerebriforme]|uniref:Uncharacterized protein n=1 Tax=Glomus cerebriforme TaxID=658196 RepID=A0A397SAN0_9GLOM|nr:hypothetical protein C1645_744172 [Glomus cerebriforme]
MAFYRCPYILRTGEVCNRGCFHPKECQTHQDSPSYIPCIECGKRTYSGYGFCDPHARKHHKKEQYHRKKQAKIALAEILVDNNKVARWCTSGNQMGQAKIIHITPPCEIGIHIPATNGQ